MSILHLLDTGMKYKQKLKLSWYFSYPENFDKNDENLDKIKEIIFD